MAKLVTLLEQHLDRLLPTVVLEATYWWETVTLLSLVKLQECGLGVHLPVKVCCYYFAYVYCRTSFAYAQKHYIWVL